MNAIYANPMVIPLAMYRYWLGVLFAPVAKATTDDAVSRASANGTKQLNRFGRRLRYVSARVQKARQNTRRV